MAKAPPLLHRIRKIGSYHHLDKMVRLEETLVVVLQLYLYLPVSLKDLEEVPLFNAPEETLRKMQDSLSDRFYFQKSLLKKI